MKLYDLLDLLPADLLPTVEQKIYLKKATLRNKLEYNTLQLVHMILTKYACYNISDKLTDV